MPQPDNERGCPDGDRTASGSDDEKLKATLTPLGDNPEYGALPVLTAEDAQRLVTKIELRLDTIADNIEAVLPLIEQAKDGNAHEALGYRSWPEFVAEKFGGRLARLGRAERMPLVQLLAEQGMSTRAIAPIVGVSKDTVSRDIRAGVSDETPADYETMVGEAHDRKVTADRETAAMAARFTGWLEDRGDAESNVVDMPVKKITGTDGKTYTRPEPRKARRSPLPDAYQSAMYSLQKSVERLERMHLDDRFGSNRQALSVYAGAGWGKHPDLAGRLTELARQLDEGRWSE